MKWALPLVTALVLCCPAGVEAGRPGRPSRFPATARPAIDIVHSRPISQQEQHRRQEAINHFERWLLSQLGAPLADCIQLGAAAVSGLLARFGQWLYDHGGALSTLTYAILAVVDSQRDWRRQMQSAWDVVAFWKDLAPTLSHRPCPFLMIRAMAGLACIWGWFDISLLLLTGFAAMLRRTEALSLRVRNFVFAEALGYRSQGLMFIQIESPKMRRRGARLEHVKLLEPGLKAFAQWLLRGRPPDQKIFSGTATAATRIFAALANFFMCNTIDGQGLTWASLRGGGASHRYIIGETLEDIKWAGRWGVHKTLDRYIQEMAALTLLNELPAHAQRAVEFFAEQLTAILAATIATEGAPPARFARAE